MERRACHVGRIHVGRVLNPSAAEGGRFASADGLRTRPTCSYASNRSTRAMIASMAT